MNRTTRSRVMRELIEIAKSVKPRRPYDDGKPYGYLESDDDYFDNNRAVAIELLDLALVFASMDAK